MDNVHSFTKRCWKNSMDNVHSTLWNPWTLSTHSMDSVDNVHGFRGKYPWIPWKMFRMSMESMDFLQTGNVKPLSYIVMWGYFMYETLNIAREVGDWDIMPTNHWVLCIVGLSAQTGRYHYENTPM